MGAVRIREYAMTRPTFYAVTYAINPWMDPSRPIDLATASAQWEHLRATYLRLGHHVSVVEPVAGLPDMVYAANGGFVLAGKAYCARFAVDERVPEEPVYADWFADAGLSLHHLEHVNEGEGDFRVVGQRIIAGCPWRTSRAAHAEIAAMTGRETVSVDLVDPRFYHLDTAFAVLDDEDEAVAYYPPAFSMESRATLSELFPDAIQASDADAAVLGLNATSDGHHVVMTDAASRLADQVRERGFEPVLVPISEFLRGGGGVKCCTLEIRR